MTEPQRVEAEPRRMEMRHVIVRACTVCSHPREVGVACQGCGNTLPPIVEELGVTAASYRSRVRHFWWRVVGAPLARRRIRAANRDAARLKRG